MSHVYSKKARELRQCQAVRKDGERCKAYARWNQTHCSSHTILKRKRSKFHKYRHWRSPAVCHCDAYFWPHRPGGGLCCWPDGPIDLAMIPEGTHRWPRLRSNLARAIKRALSNNYRYR